MSEKETNEVEELLKEILSPEEFALLLKIINNKGQVVEENV